MLSQSDIEKRDPYRGDHVSSDSSDKYRCVGYFSISILLVSIYQNIEYKRAQTHIEFHHVL